MRLYFFISALYVFVSSGSSATYEAPLDIELKLLRPVSVTKLDDILFPDFVAGVGGLLNTGDIGFNGSVGHDASFSVSGEPSRAYSVNGHQSGMNLHNGGAVINISLQIDGSNQRTLSAEGSDTFTLSAQASISPSVAINPKGVYSGSVTLIISYD